MYGVEILYCFVSPTTSQKPEKVSFGLKTNTVPKHAATSWQKLISCDHHYLPLRPTHKFKQKNLIAILIRPKKCDSGDPAPAGLLGSNPHPPQGEK